MSHRPISSSTQPDFERHVERLRQLSYGANKNLHSFFTPNLPTRAARAPGRLDIMGGIGDYSGSLVLEMPIAEAAYAVTQKSADGEIQVVSLSQDQSEEPRCFTISVERFQHFLSRDYQEFHEELHCDPHSTWAAYVLGPLLVLLKHFDATVPGGLRILIDSQVPEGKGVSSSAALGVAAMRAIAALLSFELAGEGLAKLCQLAENHVVGAPCGIMDQMTSALGREDALLALRCQPAIVEGFVSIPKELAFWGIDSGIRHAVTGSDYSSVRCGAFMGYRFLAEAAGLNVTQSKSCPDVWEVTDPQWRGYLANVSPEEFRQRFSDVIPAQMCGREFLDRFGGTTDHVTRVDPTRTYAVRYPTLHPIEENVRAARFRSLLELPVTPNSLAEMGQLMAGAHRSYSACGIGSEGTDMLVRLVGEIGPDGGLYGAKITGGGSGGSVAILGRADAGPAVERVAQQYTLATGRPAYVFRGSSPGAYGTPVAEVII
jgi:galactokinase